MPADWVLKKEMILNAINQFGNDAVIIMRVIDKETKETYTRGGYLYRDYYGYYSNYAHGPGYTSISTTLQLETNWYDVKTEELIWSGLMPRQAKLVLQGPFTM